LTVRSPRVTVPAFAALKVFWVVLIACSVDVYRSKTDAARSVPAKMTGTKKRNQSSSSCV
jgi:hypothetical protein